MSETHGPLNDFTCDQKKAITTLDRPLVVTAGPGAGKTRVLTERFLYLLEQPGIGVENIVAITFTNKAANEMRERIRQRIEAQIVAHWGTANELQWRQRKRQLEAAAIGTIHGFCSRLLHEFPLAAGVDPTFTTLDEYTASVMLDQAAQQAVTGAIDQDKTLVAELVAAYGRTTLITELKQLFNQLRSLGIPLDTAARITTQNTLKPDDYTICIGKTERRVKALADAIAQEQTAGKTGTTLQAAEKFLGVWNAEAACLQRCPSVAELPAFLAALARLREALPAARGKLGETVKPLQDALGTRSKGGGHLEAVYFDVCAQAYQKVIFEVLGRVEFLYTKAKNEVAALDFEDLQLRARELLQSEDIRRRVRDRYRHFLVDEFQDTNHLQRDILGALGLDDLAADPKSHRTFFFVGDRKQSIYAFRGAEVEVFDETIEAVTKKGGQHIRLDVNFRSDERLVKFFNALFSHIMAAPAGSQPDELRRSGFVAHESGCAHRGALDADQPAVVFLYTEVPKGDEEPSPYDDSLRDIEADRLARYVRMLVEKQVPLVSAADGKPRPPTYGDMAFLFGALTDVKTYERALRRAGVPCYVVAGHGFYGRPEVTDLLNLLTFLDNRADDLALAGVLRSPLFGLSDETLLWLRWAATNGPNQKSDRWASLYSHLRLEAEKKQAKLLPEQRALVEESVAILEELLAVRNRLPLPDLIEQAIRRTGYDIVCAGAEDGPQRLSNLDKLVALARGFAGRESHLLRDFVAYIREFRRLDAREAEAQLELGLDAVALLTIHKSKGLEFPIVVLPDLQRRWRQSAGKFVFERNCGLGFDVPDALGRRYSTALKRKVLEMSECREQFERMRQLYVAMTRAQDALILSAAAQPKAKSAADSPAQSFLDWLEPLLLTKAETCSTEETTETELQPDGTRIRILKYSTAAIAEETALPLSEEPSDPETFVEQAELDAEQREKARMKIRQRLEVQLKGVDPDRQAVSGRYSYSVVQLMSFANCPRQYYFARFLDPLETETQLERRMLEDPERSEGNARLSPAIRGLIVHRFCEELQPEDQDDQALHQVLCRAVASLRADGRLEDVALDDAAIVNDTWWLARQYAQSELRRQIDEAQRRASAASAGDEVWSEQMFTIRCGAALVTGVMDKVLISPHASGQGVLAHVVDFKTNTFRTRPKTPGFRDELVEKVAWYRLQMQSYALALWTLVPNVKEVRATLHFLEPNYTFTLPPPQTRKEAAAFAVEEVINKLVGIRAFAETDFEAKAGPRCLRCRYSQVCADSIQEALPDGVLV